MASTRFSFKKALKRPFLFAFGIGVLYFGYIFFWIWSLYPLSTVGIPKPWLAIGILLLGYAGSVLISALFWGLFGFFAPRFLKQNIAVSALGLAALFVLLEYARSWAFGLLWWGSGSTLGPHWTFGNIAYWFANVPFISQTAAFWGVYGIEFMLVVAVASVALSFYRKTYIVSSFILGSIITLLTILPTFTPGNIGAPITVSLVQTQKNIKPTYTVQERLAHGQKLLQFISQAARTAPEGGFIVLPEGSAVSTTLALFLSSEDIQKYFQNLSLHPIYILDNLIAKEGEQFFSKTLVIHSKKGVVGTYVKEILSPWGEFVPALVGFPMNLLASSNPITELMPGAPRQVIVDEQNIRIELCSDIFSPSILTGLESDFILGSSNLAFFRGNGQLQHQIRTAAQLRAVENGKYLAWAVNFGRSYAINTQGKVIYSAENSGDQILTTEIIPNARRTWYNRVGDWPLLVLSFALLLVFSKTRS